MISGSHNRREKERRRCKKRIFQSPRRYPDDLDADLTVPPEVLPKFYNAIASGKENLSMVRGLSTRWRKMHEFLNTLGNKFFSLAFTWVLEQPIKDTLCGTKVMFASDYERLVKNRNFLWYFDPFGDFDLIFGAYKLNLKI